MVESENSYIAWDFSLMQGKISMVLFPFLNPRSVFPSRILKSFDFFFLAWFASLLRICLNFNGRLVCFSLRSYCNCSRASHIVFICPIADLKLYCYCFCKNMFIFVFTLRLRPIWIFHVKDRQELLFLDTGWDMSLLWFTLSYNSYCYFPRILDLAWSI